MKHRLEGSSHLTGIKQGDGSLIEQRDNTILDEEILAECGAYKRFGRCWTGGVLVG